MKKTLALALLCAVMLSGCDLMDPDVKETSPKQAQQVVDSFVYAKNTQGLCFGVTTMSRMNTGGNVAYSNIVVNVPCEKVGL